MTLSAMFLLFSTLCAPAMADEAGTAWLRKIDAASQVSDAHLTLELTVTDARGVSSKRKIEIWQKGTEQRLVRMVEPARLKGVGLLVGANDTLHLFLPSYPPSRRVRASKRSDAFMGTDFAIEDLSRMTFSERFDAVVASAQADLSELTLTPRDPQEDDAITLWVASAGVPNVHRIEHLDASGTAVRRLTMSDFRSINGTTFAHTLKVEDLRKEQVTNGRVTQVEVGTGLADRIFTVNHLEHP